MGRIVGTMNRTEFVLEPEEAWRRGRALDRLLSAAALPYDRGVLRATHAELNRLDERRALDVARRLNSPETKGRR